MTGTSPTVKRTVFSTPRSAEFLELQALQSQTGQYAAPDGQVFRQEDLVAPAMSWQDLIYKADV